MLANRIFTTNRNRDFTLRKVATDITVIIFTHNNNKTQANSIKFREKLTFAAAGTNFPSDFLEHAP